MTVSLEPFLDDEGKLWADPLNGADFLKACFPDPFDGTEGPKQRPFFGLSDTRDQVQFGLLMALFPLTSTTQQKKVMCWKS